MRFLFWNIETAAEKQLQRNYDDLKSEAKRLMSELAALKKGFKNPSVLCTGCKYLIIEDQVEHAARLMGYVYESKQYHCKLNNACPNREETEMRQK